MERFCDLHTHSLFSDGSCTPAEIIDLAISAGLSAVALCDHNTTDGLPDFISCAKGKNITAISGVELSSEYNGTELHIVGLFIPDDKLCSVKNFTNTFNERKKESNLRLIQALNSAGYSVDIENILKKTPSGHFNRAHVAAELVALGYSPSIKDAFDNILSEKNGYYVPPKRLSSFEAIEFLSSIGAVSVLAHPLLNLCEAELCTFLPKAKKYGLGAVETIYSSYTPEQSAFMAEIAKKFDLKESGGSDFHGENKPDVKLGDTKVPYDFLEILKRR